MSKAPPPEPTRRDLLVAAAAAGASSGFPSAARATSETSADESIRPFHVRIPDEALVDLRRRIAATRWPDRETVGDESQGVQLASIQEVARYWGTDYDWRKCEAKLNALPQFVTEIDGLDIHFIHVRSKHENALPLIVTHGWPGSVIEQLRIIDPLANPTEHGASATDAFHLVIPSIPGYGFSARPTTTGWGPDRTARAWITLMKRLGYTQFVAQGGDLGAGGRAAFALESAAAMDYIFNVQNVVVVHHSFCGTTTLTPELLIEEFHDHHHADISTMFDHDSLAIMDFEKSIKYDVTLLRSSPAVPKHVKLYGFFYEISSGQLTELVWDIPA